MAFVMRVLVRVAGVVDLVWQSIFDGLWNFLLDLWGDYVIVSKDSKK